MSIRIQRNENANAITFVGSSQPAYWNNCLEGEVNETDNTRVNVVNTVRTTDSDNKVFEFFAVPFTEFRTALGTAFSTAQECADYITAQANATAIGIIEFGATDVVDFQRDATNTTILASTGHSYPVNSIKAVAQADGTITIKENVDDGADLMRFVRRTNVTFGGQTQAQQLTPVVNALNGLFTVTPVGTGADDRFISNTYTTNSPATTVFGDVTKTISGGQPIALKGTNNGSEFNDGFFTSDNPISANGEYFQFDNSGHDPLKKMMIGLMLTSEVSVAALEDNTVTGEDMDLAVRLKPNATYEHSPYGAVIENGMFSNPQRSDEYRAGIDNDGRLFISHYSEQASEWQVIVRSALVTANEEYSLVIFLKQENAACSYVITGKEIYSGPVMTYHYIESPDGDFYYPLFTTEAEANQEDINNGGSGTNHSHVFADETPTQQTWYMPSTGGTHAGSSAPSNTADITYNVISTGADANYAPAAFTITDLTVDENTAVNYQVAPAGATYTTTVSGLPSQLSLSGNNVVGTAAEVAGTNDVTPSVTSTVTVTRTNSFGSTTSDFDITVTNLDAPAPSLSSWTHVTGSGAMVDADTLDDDSVMNYDDTTAQGKRVVFSAAFVEGLFNSMGTTGSSLNAVFIGFVADNANLQAGSAQGFGWQDADMKLGFRLHIESNGSKVVTGGGSMTMFGSGTFNRDLVLFHDAPGSGKLISAVTTAGTGATMATPVFYNTSVNAGVGDEQVVIAARETTVDVTDTGIAHYDNPVVSNNLTDWTKALDFSGSNEHAKQVGPQSSYMPIKMSYTGTTVPAHTTDSNKTSDSLDARPWATSIVFKTDGNSSNQHIWNMGAGASTGNDNIYLRTDSFRNLWFQWGREGVGYNECKILSSMSTSQWYGVYIAHKGQRYNASDATAANLAGAFDIRVMSSSDSFASVGTNKSVVNQWTGTGATMDRQIGGDLTIAGRGNNRNFHGKVAATVMTTLKYNEVMPNDAEIKLIITDPKKWISNHKLEEIHRISNAVSQTTWNSYASNTYGATQVWLMGDGSSDSYANGIRNEVYPSDQSYTKLQLNNMVSNDIETVSIPGLS